MRFYLRIKETGHAGGSADLAVLGALGWVWGGVWLWWARWAGVGADLAFCVWRARVGRGIWPCWARWAVGRGVWLWWAGWAGLGADLAFCVWSTSYMSSSCLHDVFVSIFMCISDVYHGA